MADNNLMVGIGENIFEPNANLTRGMFVTILGRMAGINAAAYTTSAFTDVKVGAWYTPYVSWAASESIITGYGDSYFGVDDPITREQMATIIARYLSAAGITLSPSDDAVSSFRDAASVSSRAVEGLELMRQTEIIVGEDQGNFNPANTATRAQAATIFMRLAQAIENQKEQEPTPSESVYPSPIPSKEPISEKTNGDDASNPEDDKIQSEITNGDVLHFQVSTDIEIPTPYCILHYPQEWSDKLKIVTSETENIYRVYFIGLIEDNEVPLYSISFGESAEMPLGTLQQENGNTISVHLNLELFSVDDGWSNTVSEIASQMISDSSYTVEELSLLDNIS